MAEGTSGIVIDNGSGYTKAGFAGDDAPRCYFPSIVGKPKMPGIMVGFDQKDVYVGNEANEKRSVLNIISPIKQGVIKDWEGIEDIWFHTMSNELKVPPDQHPVLLSEPPLNPKGNREKVTSAMFEEFKVQGLYMGVQAVLALYSSGKTTGMVLDSGDGITHAVPIYEGYAIPHAIKPIELAGSDVTRFLIKQLSKRGILLDTSAEYEIAQELKEKNCSVATDYEQESKTFGEIKEIALPDNNALLVKEKSAKDIAIGKEKYMCPEILFQPCIDERNYTEGIPKIVFDSINSCDVEVRRDLYKDIILSGGNTLFSGFSERIAKELKCLAPSSMNVKVLASAERKCMVWIGGSILASLATFQSMFINRADYNEAGPSIVHRKCF